MNTAMLVPLVAAVIGYAKSRTKKGRIPNALLYGAAGYVVTTQVLPRVGVQLPARI